MASTADTLVGAQTVFFDEKTKQFTEQAITQLRTVFGLYSQSGKKSLEYAEFAKMYEITNGSTLSQDIFQTLVHPKKTLSFQKFTSLYTDVYTDEGIVEGNRTFYSDVRKLNAAYKELNAKRDSSSIFVSPKTVKPSRVRESTSKEVETGGGTPKAINEHIGLSTPNSLLSGQKKEAFRKKRKTVGHTVVKKRKKSKAGSKLKSTTAGVDLQTEKRGPFVRHDQDRSKVNGTLNDLDPRSKLIDNVLGAIEIANMNLEFNDQLIEDLVDVGTAVAGSVDRLRRQSQVMKYRSESKGQILQHVKREKQLEMQRQQIEAQEKRQAAQKAEEAMKMQASLRARQRAGQRSLLSEEREDATLGIGTNV